jgi:hypothetical protein
VTVEDRLRSTTQAVTAAMRPVRPLDLSAQLAPGLVDDTQFEREHRRDGRRRWLNWGVPAGVVAVVAALALVLVMLNQGVAANSGSTPVTGSAPAAAPPRYYVQLAYTTSQSNPMEAVVGDDHTGRKLAVFAPSADQNFYGVTAAADDRTFVVMNYEATQQETTWYLLRLTPGAAHPAQLTKLPMPPLATHVNGLALSPDGRELAVMWRSATTATNEVTHLLVYSMASGAVLHSWTTKAVNDNSLGGDPNSEGLSWVDGDRSLEFRWVDPESGMITVRAISVTGAGHDLLADGRLLVQLPRSVTVTPTTFSSPCDNSLTAGNGSVICGRTGGSNVSGEEACHTVPPEFVSYSGASGKELKVLYQYPGQCLNGQSEVLWTDPTGSQLIVFLLLAEKGVKASASDVLGVVSGGHFIKLPALAVPSGAAENIGCIAFLARATAAPLPKRKRAERGYPAHGPLSGFGQSPRSLRNRLVYSSAVVPETELQVGEA